LNAFCRFTSLSPWAIRQARGAVRPLPVITEETHDMKVKDELERLLMEYEKLEKSWEEFVAR
jgi:hypothetical protein